MQRRWNWPKRPIEYDSGFTLLPGRYSIKFLARDDETGRIGTYQTEFIIPNLNKETARVPISSVVLSSQRVDTRDALYNATQGKRADEERREESSGAGRAQADSKRDARLQLDCARCMCICRPMQECNWRGSHVRHRQNPRPPLIAFVSLYRRGKKAFESPSVAATAAAGQPARRRSAQLPDWPG